ncbi:MAG: DUF177 domain-containing protein [Gammaproteobacteria bacterium]|nr:DUF177 domain-containing protein [Gammaproteobacteria bacterium]
MGNPLHERRSAAEWSASSQVIEFAEKIGKFEQLSAIIEADLAALDADKIPAGWRDAIVAGQMKFGFADAQQALPMVKCRVTVTVDTVCQRCLEAFRLPLETEADLLLLALEQEADGYAEYEVWELEESLLQPQSIVEEMLIMALPFSALHVESAACKVLSPVTAKSADDVTTPFAALREQMAKDTEGSA